MPQSTPGTAIAVSVTNPSKVNSASVKSTPRKKVVTSLNAKNLKALKSEDEDGGDEQ